MSNFTENSNISNSATKAVSLILPNNTKLVVTSNDSNSLSVKDIFVTSLAAISAIAGGFLGARYTYTNSMKIEVHKEDKEKENEDALHERIKNLVLYELKAYSKLLETILTNSEKINEKDRRIESSELSAIKLSLSTRPRNYMQMPIERKAKVFNAESLGKVEAAYQSFDEFLSSFEKGTSELGVRFEEPGVTDWKRVIDEAVDKLNIK